MTAAIAISAPTLLSVASAETAPAKLLISKTADRRTPVALTGTTQIGKIFVFAKAMTNTARAEFWLDKSYKTTRPIQTEEVGPYDLRGGTLTAADALDTTKLTVGNHYVTIRVVSSTGSAVVETATFRVARTAPAPAPAPSTSSAPAPAPSTSSAPAPAPSTSSAPAPAPSTPPMTGYPNAANTGVPSGTPLSDLGGMLDVTDDGVYIGGVLHSYPVSGVKEVGPNGVVDISAGSVTVTAAKMTRLRNRSSHVQLTGSRIAVLAPVGTDGPSYTVDGTQSSGTAKISLSECTLFGATTNVTIAWKNFAIDRCDVSGGLDAVRLGSNTSVTNSYIHDLLRLPDSHNDIFQIIGGSNITVRHNTLLAATDASGSWDPMNAVLMIGNMTNNVNNLVFDDNFVDGGNYTFNVNWLNVDAGLSTVTNVSITNNVFGRHYRFGPKAGISHGIIWSGNTWADTGGTI